MKSSLQERWANFFRKDMSDNPTDYRTGTAVPQSLLNRLINRETIVSGLWTTLLILSIAAAIALVWPVILLTAITPHALQVLPTIAFIGLSATAIVISAEHMVIARDSQHTLQRAQNNRILLESTELMIYDALPTTILHEAYAEVVRERMVAIH